MLEDVPMFIIEHVREGGSYNRRVTTCILSPRRDAIDPTADEHIAAVCGVADTAKDICGSPNRMTRHVYYEIHHV